MKNKQPRNLKDRLKNFNNIIKKYYLDYDFSVSQIVELLEKGYGVSVNACALNNYMHMYVVDNYSVVFCKYGSTSERKKRFLKELEKLLKNKENNMENNEIKVTDKVMNETATEAITDTNNIVDNFNKDSDTIFEKEMPMVDEKDEVIYNTSLDEALCRRIETIEIEVKRLNETKKSDRIYTANNDKQKLDVIYALSEAFKYNFCKNEREKVFVMSYKQFMTHFKKCDGFSSMCDCLRLIRDFDETRDIICIKVVKELGRVVGETIIDNDTFVMDIPSFKDLDYAEVKFEDVQNIEQKLTKKVCEILGKNVKLNAKEHDLWGKILKLEDEGNANPELKAELGHVLDLYFNTVDLQNLMRCKYDNLLIECLAYKAAYKELKDLIYNELDEK